MSRGRKRNAVSSSIGSLDCLASTTLSSRARAPESLSRLVTTQTPSVPLPDVSPLGTQYRRATEVLALLWGLVTTPFPPVSARDRARTDETVPFFLLAVRVWAYTEPTKCHRRGKRTWHDRESNPGFLDYSVSTLSLGYRATRSTGYID